MKMKLKNKKINKLNFNIFKNKLNNKNLIIFLVSLFIISFITGCIFYKYLNNNDKELIKSSIDSYFTLSNTNYLESFKDIFLETIFNIFKIWLLGISVIGIIAVLFIYFTEGFSTGFTVFSMIKTYNMKGLLSSICFLFPSRIAYLLVFFCICFFAIKISYKIIILLFFKKDINMEYEMKRYFKVLILCILFSLIYSILETFISPFMINLFNMIK